MKNITCNKKIAKVLIPILFVSFGALVMPAQADAVSKASSAAEIKEAVKWAIDNKWSAGQIASAANTLGISQAQMQAAFADTPSVAFQKFFFF